MPATIASRLFSRLAPAFTVVLAALFMAAALAVLAGCARGGKTATFGSGEDLISYGEYSAQDPGTSGQAVRLKLNPNGTYLKRRFQGKCLLSESSGEWSATNESMEFRTREMRRRPDCSTEQWQVEKEVRVAERIIRNITTNSFELLDQDEQSAAEWLRFSKR
jgi:hypothetical protein